jgi:GGDEF domain-containing protein
VLAPQTGDASAEYLTSRVRAALAGVTAGLSGLSASIGTAVFPADGTSPEALLAAADLAALEAKRRARSGRAGRQAA